MPALKLMPSMAAFLDLIAWSEGTSTHPNTKNDGYDVIVSGVAGRAVFTDYSIHPFAQGRPPVLVRNGPPPLHSTASGRYQFILPTWRDLSIGLGTFSPQNQDLACIRLLSVRLHVGGFVEAGELDRAIAICSSTWASFPGNNYGQGGKRLGDLKSQYSTLLARAQAAAASAGVA